MENDQVSAAAAHATVDAGWTAVYNGRTGIHGERGYGLDGDCQKEPARRLDDSGSRAVRYGSQRAVLSWTA